MLIHLSKTLTSVFSWVSPSLRMLFTRWRNISGVSPNFFSRIYTVSVPNGLKEKNRYVKVDNLSHTQTFINLLSFKYVFTAAVVSTFFFICTSTALNLTSQLISTGFVKKCVQINVSEPFKYRKTKKWLLPQAALSHH